MRKYCDTALQHVILVQYIAHLLITLCCHFMYAIYLHAVHYTTGSCEVPLSALRDFRKTALNLPLADTPTGSLLLKLEYIPLQVRC
jgi:hypothetical protein